MTEFEKRITFRPAFDKRDPDPSKNYGIHGVEAHFALIGPDGAVSFALFTGWLLPETLGVETADWRYGKSLAHRESYPMPATISYHSPVQREDYEDGVPECPYLNGRPCYGDGTFIADKAFEALIRGGDEGLWEFLQGWYDTRLSDRDQE